MEYQNFSTRFNIYNWYTKNISKKEFTFLRVIFWLIRLDKIFIY